MNLKVRKEEMRNFFNEKIDTYDNVHSVYMQTKKDLIDMLNGNIEKVLDLGCGTGLELIYLFQKYPNVRVTAIDASEKMLEELSKRDFATSVETICGDFFEIEFGHDYDAVISTSALHHFQEEDKLVLYKKVLNCLKETGVFINCDKVAASQEYQDSALKEYLENPNLYKHMDTPLTIDNEIKILKQVRFNGITTHSVDKEDYSLIKAHK